MPLSVKTNFCTDGYCFAAQLYKSGTCLKYLSPNVKWFGTCTNSGTHHAACLTLFHQKKFCIPLTVSADVINKLNPPEKAIKEFVKNTTDYSHCAFLAANCKRAVENIYSKLAHLEVYPPVDPESYRTLLRLGAVPRRMAEEVVIDENAQCFSTALHYVFLYVGWLKKQNRVPLNFDSLLFATSCLALQKLPVEIRQKILKQCFIGRQLI